MSETRIIDPIDMQMIIEYLKANLRIEARTRQNYGYGGDTEYSTEIKLVLDGETISETSV
jgi:hypothetical protein